jgi:hypothetical protein
MCKGQLSLHNTIDSAKMQKTLVLEDENKKEKVNKNKM